MSYIGTEPKDIRSFGRTKFDYTASQGQTAFTGADDDGKVLAFTAGQIEVYVNGILMDDSDFTTTGTGTVTLASAANLNDVISIVSFESNIPDNDYVPATGGTFTGAVTASNSLTVDNDGATALTVDRATSLGTIIDVQKDGTTVGNVGVEFTDNLFIGGNSSHCTLGFGTSAIYPTDGNSGGSDADTDLGSSANRFKDLYLSGGAYLGGTGSANKLSDYEKGTWTPVAAGTSGTAFTYGEQMGHYIKVGDMVTAWYNLTNVTGSMTGHLRVSGLPFNANWMSGFNGEGVGTAAINTFTSIEGKYIYCLINDNDSKIFFYHYQNTNNDAATINAQHKAGDGADVRGFVTYYTGG